MKNENYSKYVDKIKNAINDKTIPEFGNFVPVSVEIILENNDALAFQVRPSKKNAEKKELLTSFINTQTEELVSNSTVFSSKAKLLEYIDSMNEKRFENIIKDFKSDTDCR